MILLPFESVDCRSCPGADGGWWELHALLYDPGRKLACFGVFYMLQPGQVELHYSISLPDLSDTGSGASFTATWTTP